MTELAERYGRLTVLGRSTTRIYGKGAFDCLCDCGTPVVARASELRRGMKKSCGCLRRDRCAELGRISGVRSKGRHLVKIPTYGGAHDRVRSAKGRASTHKCVDCGAQAEEWSYNHLDAEQVTEHRPATGTWDASTVTYSLSPAFYDPRCRRCHLEFDRGN